jgi:hypothetical protein
MIEETLIEGNTVLQDGSADSYIVAVQEDNQHRYAVTTVKNGAIIEQRKNANYEEAYTVYVQYRKKYLGR